MKQIKAKKDLLILFTVISALLFCAFAVSADSPANLQCNEKVNPPDLDDYAPQFTWSFYDDVSGDYQTAYQLLIGTSLGTGDAWDSGKVPSLSEDCAYYGPQLDPNTVYYWSVKVWDQNDVVGEYSEDATFSILDIGLRAFDGTKTIKIAVDDDFTSYSLRICRDDIKYGVSLVDRTDLDASKIIIQTSNGKKSLKMIDETADPPSPAISGISMGLYNTEQTFTISGEPGATVEYSLDNGGTWITYSSGVALGEGEYEIISRQTDSAGIVSVATSPAINVVVDLSSPAGYSASIGQSYINNGNKTALSFVLASAEVGATFHYSIDDANPTTTDVSGSGSASMTDILITGIDVSSLDDGTLTLTVYMTDPAGNRGADTTDTTIKDVIAPTFVSIDDNGGDKNYRAGETITFTVDLGETGLTVVADLFVLDTAYSSSQELTDNNDNTYSVTTTSLDPGTMLEGSIAIPFSAQDSAGNFTVDNTFVLLLDKTAPTLAIGPPSASVTNNSPVSYTLSYFGAVNITLAPGDIILHTTGTSTGIVTISGTGITERTVTISSISGDGTLGISTAVNTATDVTGNQALAAGPSSTFIVDNTAPTQPGTPTTLTPTADTTPTWTWTAALDQGSGLRTSNTYQVFWDTVPGGETYSAFSNTNSYTHSTALADTTWYVKVRAFDHVNHGSAVSGIGSATIHILSLPKTGQTQTYVSGDDGDLQTGVAWPSPRFTNNGDGTITDNLTGLMWQRVCSTTTVTWSTALSECDDLTLANYADWRLPNYNELLSLIHHESNTNVWLSSQGFSGLQSDNYGAYWSSTTLTSSPDIAVIFWGNSGSPGPVFKTRDYRYLAVRSTSETLAKTGQVNSYSSGDDGDLENGIAWPSPRFTDNGDGTVTDHLTGLMWQSASSSSAMTWTDAAAYCNDITTANYTDWKLPNRLEFLSLMNRSTDTRAWLNTQGFTGVHYEYHWTSTTSVFNNGTRAWVQDTMHGHSTSHGRHQPIMFWPFVKNENDSNKSERFQVGLWREPDTRLPWTVTEKAIN